MKMKVLPKCCLVALVLAIMGTPVIAAEEWTDTEYITITEHIDVEEAIAYLPDNDMLLEGYMWQEMEVGPSVYSMFTGEDQIPHELGKSLYGELKSKIADVAEHGGETRFTHAFKNTDIRVEFTPGTFNNAVHGTELTERFKEITGITNYLMYLLEDCPYELYWFDKVYYNDDDPYNVKSAFMLQYKMGYSNGGGYAYISNATVSMIVSEDYQETETIKGADGNPIDKLYLVENDVSRINAAAAKAKSVVTETLSRAKSDMEILEAYRDFICGAVDYDWAAIENGDTPYGDPWQLIHVFDGDAETKVVCEGYSKAFQYLCELTNNVGGFSGDVQCYSVSGVAHNKIGGGGGAHMWNLVYMDETVYLVDMTNVDGNWNNLFMNSTAYTEVEPGNLRKGYCVGIEVISDQYNTLVYQYDDDMLILFEKEDLLPGNKGQRSDGVGISGVAIGWSDRDMERILVYDSAVTDGEIIADIRMDKPEKAMGFTPLKGNNIPETGSTGRFTQAFSIEKVPAGEYKLAVWKTKDSENKAYVPAVVSFSVSDEQCWKGEEIALEDIDVWYYGDINNDGIVHSCDRLILARHLGGWAKYQALDNPSGADLDGDGVVGDNDLLILSRFVAGWTGYRTLGN